MRRVWIIALVLACALEGCLLLFAPGRPLVARPPLQYALIAAGLLAIIALLVGLAHELKKLHGRRRAVAAIAYVALAGSAVITAGFIAFYTAIWAEREGDEYVSDHGWVVESIDFAGTRAYYAPRGIFFRDGTPVHRGLAPCEWEAVGEDSRHWCAP